MTRTIVITGGTAGIGRQTAIALARQGARVVVTGRDNERGLEGLRAIEHESGSNDVHLVRGDLSTRSEVRALAEELLQRHPSIDVLLNNAGSAAQSFRQTQDGFELDFAVNVAAPYGLTTELLPALQAAGQARVVNLSGGRAGGPLDPGNLQGEKGFRGLLTYDHSKRATEAMSLALAERLAPHGVTVNIVYPGQAATSMTRSVTPGMLPWRMKPLWPVLALMTKEDGGKSAAKASRSSTWAATAAELAGVSGAYFDAGCKASPLHPTVRDPANQAVVIDQIERVWGSST